MDLEQMFHKIICTLVFVSINKRVHQNGTFSTLVGVGTLSPSGHFFPRGKRGSNFLNVGMKQSKSIPRNSLKLSSAFKNVLRY